jgi:pyruvate/2-oxoglutarate dehydrogenase complex dihydrolipoamide acyltransferase (E2) component
MRPIERHPFPPNRRFVIGAMKTGKNMSPMTALVEVDVTEAWERAKAEDVSPTAFLLACVGRAAAAHPEVHAYRDWVGRLVVHRQVDIATLVEVDTPTGMFPLAHPLRGADTRTVKDLSHELRTVATDPTSGGSGRLLMKRGEFIGNIPGAIRLMYAISKRSSRIRTMIGTVALSSVGMMLGGNGFAIGVPTVASLSLTVGGATEKPWVVDGEVVVRRILDLAVVIDHRVVDGAPAARFGATLRQLLETPALIEW